VTFRDSHDESENSKSDMMLYEPMEEMQKNMNIVAKTEIDIKSAK